MKLYLMIITSLFFLAKNTAQTINEKKPSLYFVDANLGICRSENHLSFLAGLGLNYQYNANLFTVKFNNIDNTTCDKFFNPNWSEYNRTLEFGIMYGKRKIYEIHSLSYSIGLSYLKRNTYRKDFFYTTDIFQFLDSTIYSNSTNYTVGIPLEFNYKWIFKDQNLIAGSIGFKFQAVLSKYSYFGMGLSVGLGYFK
jgi:hypothetical protein